MTTIILCAALFGVALSVVWQDRPRVDHREEQDHDPTHLP